jgi:hypothetical protein
MPYLRCTLVVTAWIVIASATTVLPAADDDRTRVDNSPLTTPEHCVSAAPSAIVGEVLTSGIDYSCQSCQDYIYSLYEERVRPIIDHRYPDLRTIREPLNAAVTDLNQAIWHVTDGNWIGHESFRTGANVEWMLIRIGSEKAFDKEGPGYVPDDIEQLMTMFVRANLDLRLEANRKKFHDDILPLVRSAIRHLSEAEKGMDNATVRRLRRELIVHIKQFT